LLHPPPPPTSTLFPYTTLFRSRFTAASISCGCACTERSPRNRFSIRWMKKLPPTNVCREKPDRGSPNTEVIGTSSCTTGMWHDRSEEHTSELQSRFDLVCRLLL